MKTKKPCHPVLKVLVGLAIFTLSAAGFQNRVSAAGQPEMNNGDKTMLAEKQVYQADTTVPLLDAKAPAEFETATFGLG